jgi:molecular chaperone GrpE
MSAPESRPKKVKVMDKRGLAREPEAAPAGAASEASDEDLAAGAGEAVAQAEQDLLDDLRRLQAEFDNYRKRVLREQTAMASRASARLVERLLPVLDNFERALSHGEGGPGVALVHRELRQALEQEGLEEIDAEGAPFDPRVHEAFQASDDPDVSEVTVREVYRRGYKLGDHVLRPAMVVVARPAEPEDGTAARARQSSEDAAESGQD